MDNHSNSVPGKTGIIVRLVITGLVTILAMGLFFYMIPASSPTVWIGILNVPIAIGSALMFGSYAWCVTKWLSVLMPKSRRWAQGVCSNLVALSLYGLFIKLMLWLGIFLLPLTCLSIGLIPMALVLSFAAKIGVNIFTALLVLIVGVIALGIPVILDYAKLTCQNWKDVLKNLFSRNKSDKNQPAPQN